MILIGFAPDLWLSLSRKHPVEFVNGYSLVTLGDSSFTIPPLSYQLQARLVVTSPPLGIGGLLCGLGMGRLSIMI